MALTAQQRTQLRDWLQANIHKAVHVEYYREGIKDENGKPVYGECTKYDMKTGQPLLDEEGNPITYYGRTFTLRSLNTINFREIVRRVYRKARKHGIDTDLEQVRDFLLTHQDTIIGWAGTSIGGTGTSDADIDSEDPDV